jgi:hypothetical protein
MLIKCAFVGQKNFGNYRVRKNPHQQQHQSNQHRHHLPFRHILIILMLPSTLSTGFHRGPYSSGSPATISQNFSLTKLVLDIWQEILSGAGAGLLSKQDHTV